jgi:hypothetical protein
MALERGYGSGSGPLRKKRRFDWNVFKTLRSDTIESGSSDDDELPLMKDFLDEATMMDEMSSWDPNEFMAAASTGEI